MKESGIIYTFLSFLTLNIVSIALVNGAHIHSPFHKVNKRSYDSDGYNDCGITFPLDKTGPIKFGSDDYGSSPDLSCSWTFVGSSKCPVAVSCQVFELQNNCEQEYLEVSDGTGAVERFCGNGEKLKSPIKSRSRDLYVTFKSGPIGGKKLKGFHCTVQCSSSAVVTLDLPKTSRSNEQFACVCGLQNSDDRIVDGVNAKLNEFPWQVAIVYKGTREPLCGGSLINDQYILTAGHCFEGDAAEDLEALLHARVLDATRNGPNQYDVELGEKGSIRSPGYNETRRTDADEKTIRIPIIDSHRHPLYTNDFDYDIRLLKLKTKIDFKKPDAPTPICIPDGNSLTEDYAGKLAIVSGWGLAHERAGTTTRILQKVQVPVISFNDCNKMLAKYGLTDRMMCAGFEQGGKDACVGDSGGPIAIQLVTKQWLQIGSVSWGIGCAREKRPGVYARLTELFSWLRHNSVGATWCRIN